MCQTLYSPNRNLKRSKHTLVSYMRLNYTTTTASPAFTGAPASPVQPTATTPSATQNTPTFGTYTGSLYPVTWTFNLINCTLSTIPTTNVTSASWNSTTNTLTGNITVSTTPTCTFSLSNAQGGYTTATASPAFTGTASSPAAPVVAAGWSTSFYTLGTTLTNNTFTFNLSSLATGTAPFSYNYGNVGVYVSPTGTSGPYNIDASVATVNSSTGLLTIYAAYRGRTWNMFTNISNSAGGATLYFTVTESSPPMTRPKFYVIPAMISGGNYANSTTCGQGISTSWATMNAAPSYSSSGGGNTGSLA